MTRLPKNSKVGFDNSPYAHVDYWPFIREDGTVGIQSRVTVWNGSIVVALDETTHEVYVVQQYRETPNGKVLTTEVPGGGIDEGDTPLQCAEKELLEEAGVVAVDENDWIPLYTGVNPIDGLIFTQQHAFLLLRARKVRDPNEGEGVATVKLSELIRMDNENQFRDPLGPYAYRRAYDWLSLHRQDLLT